MSEEDIRLGVEFEAVVGRRPPPRKSHSIDDEPAQLALEKEGLRRLIFESQGQRSERASLGKDQRGSEIRRADEHYSNVGRGSTRAKSRPDRKESVAAARPETKRSASSGVQSDDPRRLRISTYVTAAIVSVAMGFGVRLASHGDAIGGLTDRSDVETMPVANPTPAELAVKSAQGDRGESPVEAPELVADASRQPASDPSSERAAESAIFAPVAPAPESGSLQGAALVKSQGTLWPSGFSFSDKQAQQVRGSLSPSARPQINSAAVGTEVNPRPEPDVTGRGKGSNGSAQSKKGPPPHSRAAAPISSTHSSKTTATENSTEAEREQAVDRRVEETEPRIAATPSEFERQSLQGALESLAGMLRHQGQPVDSPQ
ncbi:hypothetical+protein [Methylocapsa aurea]